MHVWCKFDNNFESAPITVLRNTSAPDLTNSPKIEMETYLLSNWNLLCENIYYSISDLFLMLSQSNNFINSFI